MGTVHKLHILCYISFSHISSPVCIQLWWKLCVSVWPLIDLITFFMPQAHLRIVHGLLQPISMSGVHIVHGILSTNQISTSTSGMYTVMNVDHLHVCSAAGKWRIRAVFVYICTSSIQEKGLLERQTWTLVLPPWGQNCGWERSQYNLLHCEIYNFQLT